MVGIPARQMLVDITAYQRDFMPYGTPCRDAFDPATQKLEMLQCEVERLNKRLGEVMAELEEQVARKGGEDKDEDRDQARDQERGCA